MVNIPGFKATEILSETNINVVCRAVHKKSKVILKVLKNTPPRPTEIFRLKHEFDIMKNLSAITPGVVKPIRFNDQVPLVYMVMEDTGDESLSKAWPFGHIDMECLLETSVNIVTILDKIHGQNIIHKDIKPTNILWNPQSRQVQFIDFGISSQLTREQPDMADLKVLEGTLHYISPEQTGRVNHSLDYRSDYYSLGVTLYQMATGKLPFSSEDPLEIVHSHIARLPEAPHLIKTGFPRTVSRIILRLLEKSPDDRYKSLFGLETDLAKCLEEWKASGTVSDFVLGEKDFSTKFQIPEKLYGRQASIQKVLQVSELATQGNTEVLLISGYSGVGKSALIKEGKKPMAQKRGTFVSGKFDQFKKNVPYSAFLQAFKDFIHQLLPQSDRIIDYWRNYFREVLGPNGQIMVVLIPELEKILGPQPDLLPLAPAEAQNRFTITFHTFIRSLASSSHPLTIFLDDLQWADIPSLKLINYLLTNNGNGYLFVIGAYRNNEVNQGHPLILAMDEWSKVKEFQTIFLEPLTREDTSYLLADTLHQSVETLEPLQEIIYQKTAGNPFFIQELIKKMYSEGVFTFKPDSGTWEFSLAVAQKLSVSENVVDLMVERMKNLDPLAQKILRTASCIGNVFDLKTLLQVFEGPTEALSSSLWSALNEGLVVPLSGGAELSNLGDLEALDQEIHLVFQFQHDRVQQAAHSLLDEEEEISTHLRIGRMMFEHTARSRLAEQEIEIVRHLNIGLPLIKLASEKQMLVKLNLSAGKLARDNQAFRTAFDYLTLASTLMEDSLWIMDFALAFDIYKTLAEAAYLSEELEKAESIVQELLSKSRTSWEKAEIKMMQSSYYTFLGRMTEAMPASLEALGLLGLEIPLNPSMIDVLKAVLAVKLNIHGRSVEVLLEQPEVMDRRAKLWMKILLGLVPPAFITGNQNLFAVAVLKASTISLKEGNSPESAAAYAGYAILMSALGDRVSAHKFSQLAVLLNEKMNDLQWRCMIGVLTTLFCDFWEKPKGQIKTQFKQSIESGLHGGDLLYVAHACYYAPHWDHLSDLRTLIKEEERYLEIIKTTHYKEALATATLCRQKHLNWTGQLEQGVLFDGPDFSELEYVAHLTQSRYLSGLGIRHIYRLQTFFLYEEFSLGLKEIQNLDTFLPTLAGSGFMEEAVFFTFLTLSRGYTSFPKAELSNAKKRMKKALKTMVTWQENCPEVFSFHRYLIEAEYDRLFGSEILAARGYRKAIECAEESKSFFHQALAYELTAQFQLWLGETRSAAINLQIALHHYDTWGAQAKVDHLVKTHEFSPIDSLTEASTRSTTSEALDLKTIIKISQTISREIDLSSLLNSIMSIVIENTGAQRGCLILKEKDRWLIKADGDTDEIRLFVQDWIQVEEYPNISKKIFYQTLHSQEAVIIGDVSHDEQFASDEYLSKVQAKSIFCAPIVRMGVTVGIWYLENNLSPHVFTQKRLQVLSILSSQVNISIENALMYEAQKQMNLAYHRFVPKKFLELLDKDDILSIRLGDQIQKEMTVLFCDIRSFTTLSEKMTPKENFNFINSYLSRMSPIIKKHNGFIDKYIGDAIMALFWGKADDALTAALEMQREVNIYNIHRKNFGYESIDIGIGIHTGNLMLGVIGDPDRLECTVISDAINLCSRIEALTKEFRSKTILSSEVYDRLVKPEIFHLRHLGEVKIRGKEIPVALFEEFSHDTPEVILGKEQTLETFEDGVSSWMVGNYSLAQEKFKKILAENPRDTVSEQFLLRSKDQRNRSRFPNPPELTLFNDE